MYSDKRSTLTAFFLGLIITGVAVVGSYWSLEAWYERSFVLSKPAQTFEFKKNTSLRDLSQQLAAEGLVTSAFLFRLHVRFLDDFRTFQAGTYQFDSAGVTPKILSEKFLKGEIYQPVIVQITIPEGFQLKQIAARLQAHGLGSYEDSIQLSHDPKFIKSLHVASSSLEGFIFPSTYSFYKKITAREFFETAVRKLFETLPPDYLIQLQKKNLTLSQAVTFASLIELETKYRDEKNLVAEVIWRRLNRGEPLGIDAAVIYGIVNYDGNIRTRDLKNSKNIYNTRLNKGLPPTPIGSVSLSSLEAILRPSDLGYYYYVLKPQSEGHHQFSKTLREHNDGVRVLMEYYRKHGHY